MEGSDYSPSPRELRRQIDAELDRFLASTRADLPDAADLIDEITDVVAAGGKRLRPCFCYWGYRAAGGNDRPEIVRAASSLELLHTFAIVHDDIMDDADYRRGRPTVHAAKGIDFALLAGDLALVLADAAFFGSGFEPATTLAAFAAYSRMRTEVIAGQYLDLVASSRAALDESEARRIALLKSGRYTVEEPLAIGALFARAPASLVDDLRAAGALAGEAFQLRDDVLGIFGDEAVTGKPADSDIREGKRTLLYARTLAALDGEERNLFVKRWGGGEDLSDADVDALREAIEFSGARAGTEKLIEELEAAALTALHGIALPDDARAALTALLREAVNRET